MRKVYNTPKLYLLVLSEDVITSSGDGTMRFDDEKSLGKDDQIWSGF